MPQWTTVARPGYFGRKRDQIQLGYDAKYGSGNWRLAWVTPGDCPSDNRILPTEPAGVFSFKSACKLLYEESYYLYLRDRPDDLAFICEFVDCIDNSPTNVHSGLDYTIQESYSTHIQDIAVRNVVNRLGLKFLGKREELLVIRSADSSGFAFSPGNVPFMEPAWIMKPSLCPKWANAGSVEEFWQSNKILQVDDGL